MVAILRQMPKRHRDGAGSLRAWPAALGQLSSPEHRQDCLCHVRVPASQKTAGVGLCCFLSALALYERGLLRWGNCLRPSTDRIVCATKAFRRGQTSGATVAATHLLRRRRRDGAASYELGLLRWGDRLRPSTGRIACATNSFDSSTLTAPFPRNRLMGIGGSR
jgi:hypothetical protein